MAHHSRAATYENVCFRTFRTRTMYLSSLSLSILIHSRLRGKGQGRDSAADLQGTALPHGKRANARDVHCAAQQRAVNVSPHRGEERLKVKQSDLRSKSGQNEKFRR